jgi:prepilin-type N-terminal cleavage/methylation domain-containing protein
MRHARNAHGFSLIELMVALALTSVVVISVFSVMFGSQKATSRVTKLVENRQNTRAALQLLERDVRMAGSGWGRTVVQGVYGGATIGVRGVTTGYGGSLAANDTLQIMGGWDAATTLRLPLALQTDVIKVTSAAGFAVGDFMVVTSGTWAHLFKITSITTNDITCSNSSTYNNGTRAGWPGGGTGYPTGAQVYRASWVSYRVDSTLARKPMLVRREAGRPDQFVAYDVRQFTVTYLLQDESLTRNPADPSMIDRLRPVVSTRLITPGQASVLDSAWATVKPRTF